MRAFTGKRLLVATHNAGKLAEIAALLEPRGIAVTGAADAKLPEPVEDGDSFLANARIKAHTAVRATGLPALADDSGLMVEALGGKPGIHTADWAETGQGRDFAMAMTRAWNELDRVKAAFPRRATFCCTFVLAWPDGHDEAFEGRMEGQLVWPPRGEEGHGYDPIFQPEGNDRTFGEMSADEKNSISHRAKAVRALTAILP